jgi:hypothetical protein
MLKMFLFPVSYPALSCRLSNWRVWCGTKQRTGCGETFSFDTSSTGGGRRKQIHTCKVHLVNYLNCLLETVLLSIFLISAPKYFLIFVNSGDRGFRDIVWIEKYYFMTDLCDHVISKNFLTRA